MQVPDAAPREAARQEPGGDGERGAEEPVPLQGRVDAAGAEHARGSDDAPDDGRGVEDAGAGAGVAVGLVRLADARDGAQGPVEDGDLDDAGPDTSNYLGPKGNAGLLGESKGLAMSGVVKMNWTIRL